MGIARAPQKHSSRLTERVERPDKGEISKRLLLQAHPCRELIERSKRTPELARFDNSLGLFFAEPFDAPKTETDVMRAALAMGSDRLGEVLRPGGVRGEAVRLSARAWL